MPTLTNRQFKRVVFSVAALTTLAHTFIFVLVILLFVNSPDQFPETLSEWGQVLTFMAQHVVINGILLLTATFLVVWPGSSIVRINLTPLPTVAFSVACGSAFGAFFGYLNLGRISNEFWTGVLGCAGFGALYGVIYCWMRSHVLQETEVL